MDLSQVYQPHEGQAFIHSNPAKVKVLEVGRRWGKALAVDTPVPTPGGWTNVQDIQPGDFVIGADGFPARVTDTTGILRGETCYDVLFSDGTSVVADRDHLWRTWDSWARKNASRVGKRSYRRETRVPNHSPKIRTTHDIKESLWGSKGGRGVGHNHSIETAAPIQLPHATLPIDPYVLGVWLGDGHSREAAITSADSEILLQCAWAGYQEKSRRYKLEGNKAATFVLTHGDDSFGMELKALKVFGNKHIPITYLRSSYEQRLSLLQGLMDTDGSVQKGGHCEFLVTNKTLAQDTYELIGSLGIKATVADEPAYLHRRYISRRYRVSFTPDIPVFRLPRKLKILNTRKKRNWQTNSRYIVDVREHPSVPVKCINIENPDGMFLITRAFIPTHNSRAALFEMMGRYVDAMNIPAPASLVPPFHAWVVTPSFPQARQAWNEMLTFIPREWRIEGGIHQHEMFIELRGEGTRPWGLIEVKSAHDPDGLQTAGLDFLWVTEAQDIQDTAWHKMLMTLRSPGRLGYAFIEGIPSLWPDHWFAKLYDAAERGRKGFASFKFTAFDNPLLTDDDKQEIELDRDLLDEEAWNRMYMAIRSGSAGYFKNIDACIVGDELSTAIPGARYTAGLDLGRKVDPSVMIIGDATSRKVVYHRQWDPGTPWPDQREGIASLTDIWGLERIMVDATSMGGDIFATEMEERGLPVEAFIFNQNSRDDLLRQLLIAMERETIQFPKIPNLVRQLRAFQPRKTASGNVKLQAPPGEHDDFVMAAGLWLMTCDPATPLSRPIYGAGRRYMPTQDEADMGGRPGGGVGARIMRQRQHQRFLERYGRLDLDEQS